MGLTPVQRYCAAFDIADVITRAKFYVNRFRGVGVLEPPMLPFSIGLSGRPYKSTTVLHCDNAAVIIQNRLILNTYDAVNIGGCTTV